MSDSISDSIDTTGRITAGSSVTGEIETANDRDAYAVELVAGRTYRIDLEGTATDKGTLADPLLRWLRDDTGTGVTGTRDDNGGEGDNARQTFTPTESGTYYISARGLGDGVGTYTLKVTDTTTPEPAQQAVQQAPVFGAPGYAFDLAENADGSTDRVSLGTVAATDPEGATLAYRLVGGNESGSFQIDAATGELFYAGAGEDFESGTTRFTLTVQASDGSETTDTTVTVNVTDVEETVDPPATDGDETTPQTVSEPDGEDFSADTSTSGKVAVGGTAEGNIETTDDRDWFAVELVAGRTYTIDLRGSPTDDGTLSDPRLYGIHDAGGNLVANTTNDDWGGTYNSRVTYTATETDTFYIAAGAYGSNRGTYEVEVADTTLSQNADDTRTGATDLGDITALQGPRFPLGTLDGSDDQVDYYRFTLTEAKRVGLGLRRQDADANLYLEDANGTVLYSSTNSGTGNEKIEQTLLAGTYYVRVESQAAGVNEHVVRYGVSAPDADELAALQEPSGTAVNETPAFGQPEGYTFALAENADGSTNRVSLGTVAATDPEGTILAYSLVAGNESGSFEIDATSGELFYKGSGEDFESGTTRFTLTVRASDGTETADTTVTVNVTDVNETPAFAQTSYAFDLAENADGSTNRVSLGTVAATDPEGTTLAYRLAGGNESGSFQIDAASGELFYTGSGEDFESATTRFTLTVRASDGSETAETTVTVDVTDVDDTPAIRVADAEATEGDDTEMVFRVTLDSASTGTVTVNYATADGTAKAGEDYTATSGTLTFAPGETEKTVSVTIIDDEVEDSGETFALVLSEPSGGSLGDTEATGTIRNTEGSVSEPSGEDLPANTATTGEVAVGEAATGNIGTVGDRDWFKVELVAGMPYEIELKGSHAGDGTLSDPYLHGIHDAGGTLIPGTTNDDGYWSNLNSRVRFTPDTTGTHYIAAGAFGGYRGTYTVEVTEGLPGVRVADAQAIEGDDTEMLFRVRLGSASSETVTVNYATADGTATAGVDYTATSGTLTFAPGETEKTVAVTIIEDSVEQRWESFRLVLSDASGAVLEDAWARGTILNTADDYSADTTAAGMVAVGGTVQGVMDHPGDRDWFAVELVAGKTYRVDVEAGNCDAILHGIHDSSGTFIAGTRDDNGGVFDNAEKVFTATQTGTYYIAAGSHLAGRFLVLVHDVTADDFSADRSKTGSVAVGGSTTGEIETGNDRDWFAVELVAGRRYAIELRGSPTGDGTLADPHLRGIHDADGNLIARTTDGNGGEGRLNSRVLFTATETGTYYIAAGGAWRDQTGTYTVEVSEEPPMIRIANAQATEGDDTTIVFRVTLESESSGTVTVNYATADGTATARDDYTATSGTLTFAPGETEKTVSVAIIDDTAKDGGQTVLLVLGDPVGGRLLLAKSTAFGAIFDTETQTELAGQDLPADTTTTGAVAVGGTARGNIERYGDLDWFAVELAAETSYWIRLGGRSSNVGTLDWPWLAGLYDADGILIPGTTGHDWLYHHSRTDLFFTPDTAGTYYIAAGGADVGTYTLLVVEAEADDFSADTMTTGAVSVGGTAKGNIEATGDRDWFGVNLVAGTSYLIDLKGNRTNDGTLTDPRLAGIHDASGNLVSGTVDDNDGHRLNAQVRFTPDTTGAYYIAADESSVDSGERGGTYTLSVAEDAM